MECYFCNKKLSQSDIADGYDDIYYICNECIRSTKNKFKWFELTEGWAIANYKYDEWG